jgi:hypothetical protein
MAALSAEKTLAELSNPGTYAGGWRLQMRLAANRTGSGLCCEKFIMTDLMKALQERREQLRNRTRYSRSTI